MERYSASGSIQSGPYLFQPIGLPVFYDIGYKDGNIWYACDDSDSPVKAFSTSGALVDYVMASVIPAANGLCLEDDQQYMWVSDLHADNLYRVNLSPTGIEQGETATALELGVSMNPFFSSVTIHGEGFGQDAVLEIFDLSGRKAFEAPFQGNVTWSGSDSGGRSVPSGVYVVVVRDAEHTESFNLTRL